MPNFQIKPRETPKPPAPETWNFAPVENETKILAFSGKLGSGKSSASHFLHSLSFMYVLGLTEHAYVDENGKLVVKTAEGDYNEVNLNSKHPEVVDFLSQRVWPFMKNYSFARPLKDFCVTVLGLDETLVYGTQEDKNTLTHLKWESMPTKVVDTSNKDKKTTYKSGAMTVREVLEYIGELMRKVDPNCWANALVRTIQQERPAFAIIDDLRYRNELDAIMGAGGKVIRLSRSTDEALQNTHASNTELDDCTEFSATINNSEMTMEDSFRELISLLTQWEWFKVVQQ